MVWSPHVGHQARGAQMWTPKPVDSRPLYGLQMMMGSPQYSQQQEETMDLSASAQDLPKALGDPLRNGTVNGETESIVTSVIATNPLREATPTDPLREATPADPLREATPADPLNCSKRVEESSNVWESSDHSVSVREPEKSFNSSVLVPDEAAVELNLKNAPTDLDRLSDFSFSDNFVKESGEQSSQNLDSVNKDNSDIKTNKSTNPNESHSYLDNSCLSVETDESRLVVAESSAEDIFGISPVDNITNSTSQEIEKSVSLGGVISSTSITDSSNPREQWPLRPELPVVPASHSLGPDPSVENVEILLESMFNSQEETSCSSQTSSSGVPQSVIVSNGVRMASDATFPVDRTSPMKEEELAKTLAEDTPVESDIQEEVKIEIGDKHKENIQLEEERIVKDEQKSSAETAVPDDVPNTDDQIKDKISIPELDIEDSTNKEIKEESIKNNLSDSISEPVKEETSEIKNGGIGLLGSAPEPSSSSNPFIEVETQLEKMFAGIVEPVDEASSDAQPLAVEPTKLTSSKKGTRKRKKANNRRPSDNSVFGGSSGDSVPPFKKKGRKRVRDNSGNEKSSKRMKIDFGESSKKGKAMKENVNDSLSSKVKGPFVHIEGTKESPTSVVVVNSGSRADDDDGVDKVSNRWKNSSRHKPEGNEPNSL